MDSFKDILEPRRNETSNFLWVSRRLNTTLAYKQNVKPNPEQHKDEVLRSYRIKEIIEKISNETGTPKTEIEHQVKLILDEIGFNRQLKIIRWLGLFLAKVFQRIYSGIYVNEAGVERLRAMMGTCPVIFAPSHRSYADFILMSYICFTYNLEIPAIAAGMDFHAMWGMGKVLRDTGAFFMRRSYNDDPLYWDTFKQYINQIVTKGDSPIEFFIEGTRSRSCKSLVPKFGLLSMILKSLFSGQIPDIIIVPINLSYDRVLEERLFAFELLGIPKPKESTSGMFKALSVLKEHFGNIYVDFAQPISIKEYFGEKLNRTGHVMGPVHHQQLTVHDRQLINDLGYEVLRLQRSHATVMTFNLVAISLEYLKPSNVASLSADVTWLRAILQKLGAHLALDSSLEDCVAVHGNLFNINNGQIELIQPPIDINNIDPNKLKGHRLSGDLMKRVIPNLMLQLYVNPTLHYVSNSGLIITAILTFARSKYIDKDELFGHFRFLRTIFAFEFVFYNKMEHMEFEETLSNLCDLNVIEMTTNGYVSLSNNERLQILLINLMSPFIFAYYFFYIVLQQVPENTAVEQAAILIDVQRQIETILVKNIYIHSYSLNLDTLTMCLQSLTSLHVLNKYREANKTHYKINQDKLKEILYRFENIVSMIQKLQTESPKIVSAQLCSKL